MTTLYDDPFAAAADPQEITYSNDVYGDIALDMWFCTLKKGVGKAVFIPEVDRVSDRRTAVDINITDLGGTNYKRSFIAEISNDGWRVVTLPSLQALGVNDMRAMNGKFVHAVMEPFGEYTDKTTGETKKRTAPKIVTIYASRDECEAACQAAEGAPPQADWLTAPLPAAPNGNGSAPANGHGNNGSDAERATAAAFLPAFAMMAREGNGINSQKMAEAIQGNPLLAKYFTLASPEVAQAIEQALSEPAF
jgi:hypothetical protein